VNWRQTKKRILEIREQAMEITTKRARGAVQVHPEALELRRQLEELAQQIDRPRRRKEKPPKVVKGAKVAEKKTSDAERAAARTPKSVEYLPPTTEEEN
jgi:hypothetical protein